MANKYVKSGVTEDVSEVSDNKRLDQKPTPVDDMCMEFDGNRTRDSDMITVKIDLTDPEDLLKKLEMLDLTDEETDEIFDKAQELNRWLRRELQNQNAEDVGSVSRSSSFLISAPSAKGQRGSSGSHQRAHPVSALPPLLRQTSSSQSPGGGLPVYSKGQFQGRQHPVSATGSHYSNSKSTDHHSKYSILSSSTKELTVQRGSVQPNSSVFHNRSSASKE